MGDYKTAGNYKITPLTMQLRLQSIVWLQNYWCSWKELLTELKNYFCSLIGDTDSNAVSRNFLSTLISLESLTQFNFLIFRITNSKKVSPPWLFHKILFSWYTLVIYENLFVLGLIRTISKKFKNHMALYIIIQTECPELTYH